MPKFEKSGGESAKKVRKNESKREVEQAEGGITLERAIEILGRENVHGPEDVEFLLGFKPDPKDIPTIPYKEDDLKKSKEVKEKTGVEEMLVLFASNQDGRPMSLDELNVLVSKKYEEMGLGNYIINPNQYYPSGNKEDAMLKYEWKLVTKQCIPDSKGRWHDHGGRGPEEAGKTQEDVIKEFADKVGVSRARLHRPSVLHMLYAVALHLVSTERLNGKGKGERLLQRERHWSDAGIEGLTFYWVGVANVEHGAWIEGGTEGDSWHDLGVCLSRDSE